jgi:hypothetical protein
MFADAGGIIASTVQFGIWHPPQLGALNQSLSTPPDHTTKPGLGVKLTGELKKFIVNPDVLLEKVTHNKLVNITCSNINLSIVGSIKIGSIWCRSLIGSRAV